jgi:hypothetical protein
MGGTVWHLCGVGRIYIIAGISTAAAELLLARMRSRLDDASGKRCARTYGLTADARLTRCEPLGRPDTRRDARGLELGQGEPAGSP